jgi:hypothetical protein
MKWLRFGVSVAFLLSSLLFFSCTKDAGDGSADSPKKGEVESKDLSASQEVKGEDSPSHLLANLQVGEVESRRRAAEKICSMDSLDAETLGEIRDLLVADDSKTREAAAYTLG